MAWTQQNANELRTGCPEDEDVTLDDRGGDSRPQAQVVAVTAVIHTERMALRWK